VRDVVQFKDLKVQFQPQNMDQIRSQLRVIIVVFTLELLDDELGVTFQK
jgi:hypothetical protein